MGWDDKYILNGKIPVPCSDTITWARWYETADKQRIVRQETIGDYWVSTVFLALDHGSGSGPPLLFETLVFYADRREDAHGHVIPDAAPLLRTPTWELALEAHASACLWAREHLTS